MNASASLGKRIPRDNHEIEEFMHVRACMCVCVYVYVYVYVSLYVHVYVHVYVYVYVFVFVHVLFLRCLSFLARDTSSDLAQQIHERSAKVRSPPKEIEK